MSFNYTTFLAVILIYLPMIYLSTNRKSRERFFEINSKGKSIILEVFSGIVYALMIFLSLFLSENPIYFMKFSGIIIYGLGLILTYIGYFKFIKGEKIIQSFPFNISRNPTYFFAFVSILGVILFSDSLILFGLLVLQFLFTNEIVKQEERFLEKKYGKEYLEYKKKVKRYLGVSRK